MIGTKKLLEMVNNPEIRLVKGLCERELTNPEGEGFDLRVGEVYRFLRLPREELSGFLGIKKRSTPEVEPIGAYNPTKDKQQIVTLKPGDYRLIRTIESINLPNTEKGGVSALFTPRTTLQRSGIQFISSNASPGYSGHLTFGLKNIGSANFYLELGARALTALFFETTPNESSYRGQWSEEGGKVSTQGQSEKQV